MAIPFSTHPRRVVIPDGAHVLVAVRRDWPKIEWLRLRWLPHLYPYVDLGRRIWWLVRPSSRTWLVEMYVGVDEDVGVPHQAATRAWKVTTRDAANAYAELLAQCAYERASTPVAVGVVEAEPRAAR